MVVDQASVAAGSTSTSGLGAAAGQPAAVNSSMAGSFFCVAESDGEAQRRQAGRVASRQPAGAAVATVEMGQQCGGTPAPVSPPTAHSHGRDTEGNMKVRRETDRVY